MADGFLGRWAKRKNDALQGKPLDEPAPSRSVAASVNPAPSAAGVGMASSATPSSVVEAKMGTATDAVGVADQEPKANPPLTLDDVQSLTKDSDFKPFMNKAVEPGVRNAAMKKLFTDPHFNVMDRMDIYIDDYSLPDPIPAAMLRQMVSAKFLKLFEDEEEAQENIASEPTGQAGQDRVAQTETAQTNAAPPAAELASATPEPAAILQGNHNLAPSSIPADADPQENTHAHPDLRLQPDHAAEGPDPGRSAA